jgi:hypothetical protein
MPALDHGLSARMEAVEAAQLAALAQAVAEQIPAQGAASIRVGGGTAAFVARGLSVSRGGPRDARPGRRSGHRGDGGVLPGARPPTLRSEDRRAPRLSSSGRAPHRIMTPMRLMARG